jgi:hypothetical protein
MKMSTSQEVSEFAEIKEKLKKSQHPVLIVVAETLSNRKGRVFDSCV